MLSKNDNLKSVLIIDDDPLCLRFIQEILRPKYRVFAAPSGEMALQFLKYTVPDLIILDVEMPVMDGYEVLRNIKYIDYLSDVPIIFLTSSQKPESEEKAFALGAVDFINKPTSSGIVRARVELHMELMGTKRGLEKLVDKKSLQLEKNQNVILDILANITAFRDNETGAHIKRTTDYTALLVANLLAIRHPSYIFSAQYGNNIVKSAKLHDIGKVAVPDNILLKNGGLTYEEFNRIKLHTRYGAYMLDSAITELGEDSSFLNVAREIVIAHHEWWNGGGYPFGLVGTQIPISARIMGIADVYDALISRRPYKEPMSHEEAVKVIFSGVGEHFDPTLVEISSNIFDRFKVVAKKYSEKEESDLNRIRLEKEMINM